MKFRLASLLGVLSLATVLSTTLGGQISDGPLLIAGVQLTVGMPEATVREQLARNYTISPGGLLTTKSGPPFEIDGSVTFQAGRLQWASKSWDTGLDQTASVDVVRRIVGMMGDRSCVATTTKIEEPQFRSVSLLLRCSPTRSIEVSVAETPGTGKQYVNLREILAPAGR